MLSAVTSRRWLSLIAPQEPQSPKEPHSLTHTSQGTPPTRHTFYQCKNALPSRVVHSIGRKLRRIYFRWNTQNGLERLSLCEEHTQRQTRAPGLHTVHNCICTCWQHEKNRMNGMHNDTKSHFTFLPSSFLVLLVFSLICSFLLFLIKWWGDSGRPAGKGYRATQSIWCPFGYNCSEWQCGGEGMGHVCDLMSLAQLGAASRGS